MQFTPRCFTQVSTLALLGALGSLGFSTTASAAFLSCSPQTGGDHTSEVRSDTFASGGAFDYNFKVCNTSGNVESGGQLIYDWELPYDPNVGISAITSPEGWNFAIETIGVANSFTGWDGAAQWQIAPPNPNDPLGMYDEFPAFRTHTQVLHWFTCQEANSGERNCNQIFPGNSLEGFGFNAPLGPVNGPYQASWQDVPPRTGDPDVPVGIPFILAVNGVPEPGGLALFALGLGALMAARRRKVALQD